MKQLATDIRNEADQDGDFEVVQNLKVMAGYSKNLGLLNPCLHDIVYVNHESITDKNHF